MKWQSLHDMVVVRKMLLSTWIVAKLDVVTNNSDVRAMFSVCYICSVVVAQKVTYKKKYGNLFELAIVLVICGTNGDIS